MTLNLLRLSEFSLADKEIAVAYIDVVCEICFKFFALSVALKNNHVINVEKSVRVIFEFADFHNKKSSI
jgi:hypothetical protein